MRLHQRFERFNFHPQLALIVDCAARIDVAVALGRLKWRRYPLIQRVRRLHVEMRIHQNRRRALGMQPVGIKKRMTLRGNDLDILHADAAQFAGHEVGGFLDVGLVFLQRAHAGNA